MSNGKRSDLIVQALYKMASHHRAIPQILKLLGQSHPADIARALVISSDHDRLFLWGLVPTDLLRAETLVECQEDVATELLNQMKDAAILRLVQALEPDDTVHLTGLLPEERQNRIHALLQKKDPESIRVIEAEKETAARLMTNQFLAISQDKTVADALDLMKAPEEVENVFYFYITDTTGRLVGVVSLKELLRQEDTSMPLAGIMTTEVFSTPEDLDQEEAASMIEKYNLLALPVVNKDDQIVGIITVDDALDVISEEAHEDMLKFSGVVTNPEEPKVDSVARNIKQRLPWLLAGCLGGIFAMKVLSTFEPELSKWWFLAIFIPIINGTSGNVGIQASMMMIHGLLTNRIEYTRIIPFFVRELTSGLVLGLIFGSVLAAVTFVLFPEPRFLYLIVGVSLLICMTLSTAIGVFVPFIFHRIGIDPSLGASPLIPTLIDIMAVIVFFTISSWLLTHHIN